VDIKQFVTDFENALDNVQPGSLTEESKLKEIKQMDSLGVLSIIAMMHKKYQTKIKGLDIRNSVVIRDLFNLIQAE